MTDTTDFPPDAMLGYGFQHDETGNTTFVSADEVDDFARLNPRWSRIGPAYLISDRASRAPAQDLTDDELDKLWLYRANIHDGQLMPQLRDFARAVLAAAPSAQAPALSDEELTAAVTAAGWVLRKSNIAMVRDAHEILSGRPPVGISRQAAEAPQYNDSVPPIWETLGVIGREEMAAASVRAAIKDYHFALDSREHGGLAARAAVFRVEAALDMPWIQGAEVARRALSSKQEGGKT